MAICKHLSIVSIYSSISNKIGVIIKQEVRQMKVSEISLQRTNFQLNLI